MSNVISLLEELVSFHTENPDGNEMALARRLEEELKQVGPDELLVSEAPRPFAGTDGAYVYARWGNPKLLINAHLDTVLPNDGWSTDPFTAKRVDDRLYGLGTADTKGAIAAVLTALHQIRPKDVAILFSGDEERGSGCMKAFLETPQAQGLTQAIVCEPTGCRVGVRHRGVLCLVVGVDGPGGHSSRADMTRSPLKELGRLVVALDEWGQAHLTKGPRGFEGMCLNIAKLDGGMAFNTIPAQGQLWLSVRCPPGTDADAVREELTDLATKQIPDANVLPVVSHPPFGTRELTAFAPWLGDLVRAPVDLDFWTEAALLSRAGIDAVVFGPGDIANAHAPNEWVPVGELERARSLFVNLFEQTQVGQR